MDTTYLNPFQTLYELHSVGLSLKQFPDHIALLLITLRHGSHPVPCSAYLPKQEDFRTFLMSEDCAETARLVGSLE